MCNLGLLKLIPVLLVIISLSCTNTSDLSVDQSSAWPEITATMKPWTRWWWMGNAVDKENISRRLEEFAEAGIGGVEITPIYGTKGYEDRFIQHLSEEWMEMLIHTLEEGERLGLGVDMILGTGWPYGGPQVEPEYAAGKLYIQSFELKEGERIVQKIQVGEDEQPDLAEVQFIFAFYEGGEKTDLTGQLEGDQIDWTADKDCMLYAVISGKTGQQVKRSAPGGEGFVLDHFSKEALEDYLQTYEDSLGQAMDMLRAVFNDSYEVYQANYTPEFLDEFQQRRGYDLTDHLPALYAGAQSEDLTRIISDYRLTLSDLVLENFSVNWTSWANDHSCKSKYQAHGSPGNLIDLYA
ncbi:MAG: glycosyl hydrolase, partial [Bacteroidales bacterium]